MNERDAVFLTDRIQLEFLQNNASSGFEQCWKIPLSLQAYGLLLRQRFERVKSYVDFVDFGEIKHWYLDAGIRYSRNWLSELGLTFKVEGIDLAELDAPCQFLLFTHLRFIEKTAERIIKVMPDIERFHVVQSRDPLESEFYFDSDVASAVLRAVCSRLGRRVEVVEMAQRPAYMYPWFQRRPITDAALGSVKVPPKNSRVNRIGLAPATVANAISIFESLRDVLSQTFVFRSTWDPGLLSTEANCFRLSAADGNWSQRIANRLDKIYKKFLSRRGQSTLPDSIIRNAHLDFQFEYIIRRRWRAYANMICRGKQLVRDIPLNLFIHSDHFTTEGAVLSRLYRKRGTKILISLHSNYPCDQNWASWHRDDRAMVPSESASIRLSQLSGIKEIYKTGDPILRNYQSLRLVRMKERTKAWKQAAGDRKLLLVITNALELNCVPFVDLKAHFEAMAVLANITDGLKERVAVMLRTKPGAFGEDPILYQHLSGFFPEVLSSAETPNFSECIQGADCIVGVNVATGGYYKIMQSGVPLIHFQMADVVSRQPDLPAEAITVVTNPAALHAAIESLLFDEQFRNAALRRQRDFAANDFRPDYPGDPVRTVVQKLIEKRRSSWKRRHKLVEKRGPDMSSKPPVDISSLPTSPFTCAGYVDDILYAPNGRCRADGWAADLSAGHPAKAVHIFVNDCWIAKGVPALERPDVAAAHNNPNFLAAGFSVAFRVEHTELLDELRVYAEMQDGTFHLLARSFDDQISS
jgi:hypothetical protein